MNKFLNTAKKITATVLLITGFVAALAAAMKAFSDTMKVSYPDIEEKTISDEPANN